MSLLIPTIVSPVLRTTTEMVPLISLASVVLTLSSIQSPQSDHLKRLVSCNCFLCRGTLSRPGSQQKHQDTSKVVLSMTIVVRSNSQPRAQTNKIYGPIRSRLRSIWKTIITTMLRQHTSRRIFGPPVQMLSFLLCHIAKLLPIAIPVCL